MRRLSVTTKSLSLTFSHPLSILFIPKQFSQAFTPPSRLSLFVRGTPGDVAHTTQTLRHCGDERGRLSVARTCSRGSSVLTTVDIIFPIVTSRVGIGAAFHFFQVATGEQRHAVTLMARWQVLGRRPKGIKADSLNLNPPGH